MAGNGGPTGMSNSDLWKWVLGLVAAILMLLTGSFANSVSGRLERLDDRQRAVEIRLSTSEEVSRGFERQLNRIESKLDNLVDEHRSMSE